MEGESQKKESGKKRGRSGGSETNRLQKVSDFLNESEGEEAKFSLRKGD